MLDLARWDWSRHWPYLAGALVVLASAVLVERARRRAVAERARVAALPEEARKALENDRTATRDRRGRRVEDLLTAAVAAAAAGLSAAQLGKFGRDVMGLHGPWAYLPFVALDFAAVVCALRARRRAARGAAAGLSGALVWVLALLSASMSASEGANVGEAFALGIWAPIAAVLWELGLAEERHARTERADRRVGWIRWLHPIERVLVLAELAADEYLGAADATERVRERRAARALYRLRQATEARAAARVDGTGRSTTRPKRGLDRRYRRAEAFAQRTAARVRLADAEVEAAVLPQLRVLVDVGRLANMTWPAPDLADPARRQDGRAHVGTTPPTLARRVAGVAVSAPPVPDPGHERLDRHPALGTPNTTDPTPTSRAGAGAPSRDTRPSSAAPAVRYAGPTAQAAASAHPATEAPPRTAMVPETATRPSSQPTPPTTHDTHNPPAPADAIPARAQHAHPNARTANPGDPGTTNAAWQPPRSAMPTPPADEDPDALYPSPQAPARQHPTGPSTAATENARQQGSHTQVRHRHPKAASPESDALYQGTPSAGVAEDAREWSHAATPGPPGGGDADALHRLSEAALSEVDALHAGVPSVGAAGDAEEWGRAAMRATSGGGAADGRNGGAAHRGPEAALSEVGALHAGAPSVGAAEWGRAAMPGSSGGGVADGRSGDALRRGPESDAQYSGAPSVGVVGDAGEPGRAATPGSSGGGVADGRNGGAAHRGSQAGSSDAGALYPGESSGFAEPNGRAEVWPSGAREWASGVAAAAPDGPGFRVGEPTATLDGVGAGGGVTVGVPRRDPGAPEMAATALPDAGHWARDAATTASDGGHPRVNMVPETPERPADRRTAAGVAVTDGMAPPREVGVVPQGGGGTRHDGSRVAGERRHVADLAVAGASNLSRDVRPESSGRASAHRQTTGARPDDADPDPDPAAHIAAPHPVPTRDDADRVPDTPATAPDTERPPHPRPATPGPSSVGTDDGRLAEVSRTGAGGSYRQDDAGSWAHEDLHQHPTADVRWQEYPHHAEPGASPNPTTAGATGPYSDPSGHRAPDRNPTPGPTAEPPGTLAPSATSPRSTEAHHQPPTRRTGPPNPSAPHERPSAPTPRRDASNIPASPSPSPADSAAGTPTSAISRTSNRPTDPPSAPPSDAPSDRSATPPGFDPADTPRAAPSIDYDYDIPRQSRRVDGSALTSAARRDHRVLTLVSLLTAETDLTGEEVGDRLGVSERTADRLLQQAHEELIARRAHAEDPDLTDAGL